MRKILIIGAGKSTAQLIKYLSENSKNEDLQLVVGDRDLDQAHRICGAHVNTEAVNIW